MRLRVRLYLPLAVADFERESEGEKTAFELYLDFGCCNPEKRTKIASLLAKYVPPHGWTLLNLHMLLEESCHHRSGNHRISSEANSLALQLDIHDFDPPSLDVYSAYRTFFGEAI